MAAHERKFVFYDTETTGTNIEFDQIIQFAAILTDQSFREIDRINVRCRRLPWVIPSPGAMIVTSVSPTQIDDPTLPQFPEMMSAIQEKIRSWSPAIFIGYNSFQFDEPLLQRALWLSLNPPYITVTNGNARADLLPLVRAVSRITPHALDIPNIASGRPVFRLDRLAPLNGFSHINAHDALGDVQAVIHIGRRIASRSPALWSALLNCANRTFLSDLLDSEGPIFFAEPLKNGRPGWWGLPIGEDANQKSTRLVVNLETDWSGFFVRKNSAQDALIATPAYFIRRMKENMFPIAFGQTDAAELFGIFPSKREIEAATFLRAPPRKAALVKLAMKTKVARTEAKALEQRIFEGFPSKEDDRVMQEFASIPWSQRAALVQKLDDPRLQQIAQRLIFLMAPESLSETNRIRVAQGIRDRLLAPHGDPALWRTISLARSELDEIIRPPSQNGIIDDIEKWLVGIETSLAPAS
jgi:exodeoxyribonuclease I